MPPEDLTFRRLRTYAWESGVYLQRNTRKATGSPHAHLLFRHIPKRIFLAPPLCVSHDIICSEVSFVQYPI